MAAIFGKRTFFENLDGYSTAIPRVKNFVEIALSRTVYEKNFENFEKKNSKWLPFLTRQNVFEKLRWLLCKDTYGSKISSKSFYLARFMRYKHFCVLQFLRKIRKLKMAAIFDETKIF